MGEHSVEQHVDERKSQAFMKALLEDLRGLAFMLQNGRVGSGVRRIGAEQEMFLIDETPDGRIPYRTPQTLVGGPRADAALAARTATTMAMGKGSTQHRND